MNLQNTRDKESECHVSQSIAGQCRACGTLLYSAHIFREKEYYCDECCPVHSTPERRRLARIDEALRDEYCEFHSIALGVPFSTVIAAFLMTL